MNQIDPNKFYNVANILNNEWFPWALSNRSIRNWIIRDKEGKNLLQAQIYGEGVGMRYLIKGENLIKFIANFEDGSLHR